MAARTFHKKPVKPGKTGGFLSGVIAKVGKIFKRDKKTEPPRKPRSEVRIPEP